MKKSKIEKVHLRTKAYLEDLEVYCTYCLDQGFCLKRIRLEDN